MKFYPIISDKDVHFTGAIAQNGMETESLDLDSHLQSIGVNEIFIRSVSVQSKENLEWDVYLFGDNNFNNTDLDLDRFTDNFNFPLTSGLQIGGANQYYYPSPSNNIQIPYKDEDLTSKMHVGLVCRTAGGKSAGTAGQVVIRFMVDIVR